MLLQACLEWEVGTLGKIGNIGKAIIYMDTGGIIRVISSQPSTYYNKGSPNGS